MRRRARRRDRTRRGITLAIAALASVGIVYFVFLGRAPGRIPAAASEAAAAAGCTPPEAPATPAASAPGGLHLSPGASYTYDQHPATSGYHDPSPLPDSPAVYSGPIPETRAVHNLEHAFVIVYYRADGVDALAQAVVDRLQSQVRAQDRVLMAPYPDLRSGTALALTAWNKLWECPAKITPDQAATMERGMVQAYEGTSNAPEPPSRIGG